MNNSKAIFILENRQFLILWLNQIFLQVGFNLCNYTVLLILAHRTHSPFVQAQFFTSLILPAFVFGLFAGPIVDMVPRKRLLLIADLVLGILFFLYLFAGNSLLIFIIIAFFTAACARFFIPAQAATIPLIVARERLNIANALFIFTLMGSVIFGYIIASPIVEIFGGLGTRGELAPFLISSVFVFIGLFLLFGFKDVRVVKPRTPAGTLFKKTFYLFVQTAREIKVNKNVSLPILLLIFVELNVGVLSVIFLEYVRRFLQLPHTSVSTVLMMPLVFGLVSGVAMLSKIQKRYGYRRSIYGAVLGIGFLFLALGLLPSLGRWDLGVSIIRFISVISAFTTGILVVVIAVQSRTILQTSSDLQMQGRIFSFLDIMIAIATPVPVLLIALTADKISIPGTFVVIGILIVLVLIAGERILFGKGRRLAREARENAH